MNNPSRLRIAVVSDMHCMHKKDNTPSGITFLYSNQKPKPTVRHPVYALLETIKTQKIKADILICPGDIADKADDQGLISGWDYLKKIKTSLGARFLFATIGNHDVDSRKIAGTKSPFEIIKSLDDDYPLPVNNDDFWSKNYSIFQDEDFEVLIINSAHNHISAADAAESYVSPETLENIRTSLKNSSRKSYRFAVCHHHPVKHSNIDIDYKDGDVIDNGDKLIALLEEFDFQIIVHGHKHDARLKRENSMTVFAAGSFSSLMNIKELGADNCFHIINLLPTKKQGTIESLVYAPTKGWGQRKDREFPCYTGFGSEKTVEVIAKECLNLYNEKKCPNLSYKIIQSVLADIDFLIPEEQKKLSLILQEQHGLALIPELPDIPRFLTSIINE